MHLNVESRTALYLALVSNWHSPLFMSIAITGIMSSDRFYHETQGRLEAQVINCPQSDKHSPFFGGR